MALARSLAMVCAIACAGLIGAQSALAAPQPPTKLQATAAGATQVALAWQPSSASTGAPEGYEVLNAEGKEVARTDAYTTNYLATGLTAGTGYTFSVRAYAAAEHSSTAELRTATVASGSLRTLTQCEELKSGYHYVLATNLVAPAGGSCLTLTEAQSGATTLDCQRHTIETSKEAPTPEPALVVGNQANFLIVNCDFYTPQAVSLGSDLVTVASSVAGVFDDDLFAAGQGKAEVLYQNTTGVVFNSDVFTNVPASQHKGTEDYFGHNAVTTPSQATVTDPFWLGESGSANTVDANVLDGDADFRGYEGPLYGADDIIGAGPEAGDTLVGNTVSDAFDCGYESGSLIADTKFIANVFDNAWASAICSYYNTSWLGNSVIGNSSFYSGTLVTLNGSESVAEHESENDLLENKIEKNVVSHSSEEGLFGDSLSIGEWNEASEKVKPAVPFRIGGNVIRENEFGSAAPTPRVQRLTPAVLGAGSVGNRCPVPTTAELEAYESLGCVAPTASPVSLSPRVAGVYPPQGPVSGGTTISVEGAGFEGATEVVFETAKGEKATGAIKQVLSGSRLVVQTPPGAEGAVSVRVKTPAGESPLAPAAWPLSTTDHFTYGNVPVVTSLSVAAGAPAGGTATTITGANLGGATAVDFGTAEEHSCEATGGVQPCFTVGSGGTTIQATSEPDRDSAAYVNVTVQTPSGTSATTEGIELEPTVVADDEFTYRTVSALSRTVGPTAGGTPVTLTGQYLQEGDLEAGSVAECRGENQQHESIRVPCEGARQLQASLVVMFGNKLAGSVLRESATEVIATAPPGTGTVHVTVVGRGGASAEGAANQFTYVAAPTIASLSSRAGSEGGGTQLRIAGTGLQTVEHVTFGGTQAASFEVRSATEIVATTPPHVGSGEVVVAVHAGAAEGATTTGHGFTYAAGHLSVESLQTTSGPESGGTSVKIKGRDLEEAESVSFGLIPATSFTVNSAESITAVAPAGTGTVNVRVGAPFSGHASAVGVADQFTYVGANPATAPTVSNVQANAGPEAGGVQVVITGRNFLGATAVSFGSKPAASYKVLSATAVSAVVPEGGGSVDVTVSNAKGTSPAVAADQFTYRSAGAPLGWGADPSGQLGDNSTESETLPKAASGGGEASALAGGDGFTLALMKGGEIESYGANASGELGDGGTEPSRVPVPVRGLPAEPAVAVAAGAEHGLALTRNGHVWAWGDNDSGQLGDGSTERSTVPVEVPGLGEVAAIAAGDSFSLALKANGTVWAWGANAVGQLGDAQTTSSDTPVELPGIDEVVAIAAHGSAGPGGNHALALLRNGTVAAWGENAEGDLGTGSASGPETCNATACSKQPVAVTELTEATAVAVGAEHSLALQASGTVKAWGSGFFGELGRGSFLGSGSPVGVANVTEGTAVAAGKFHSLALLKNGKLEAWGENRQGQLGDDTSTGPERCVGVFACAEEPTEVQGLGSVTSIGAGEYSSLAAGVILPAVTGIQPSSGPAAGGTVVIVTGTGFTHATAVRFGSTAASSFRVEADSEITARAPAGTGVVDVTVQTPVGTSATGAADQYSYLASPAPPVLFSNSAAKPVIATCIAETEVCPGATERHSVRSQFEPTLGWGPLTLHAAGFGAEGVRCTTASSGALWNEHEAANTENPIRAYAVISGWSTANCTAPGLLEPIEHASATGPLTVYVTAEQPLQEGTLEGEICTASERGVYKRPSECAASERTTTELVRAVRRQSTSLPWKAELIRGKTKDGQAVVVQRIGIASYGECGPGEGEATAANPVKCRARERNSKCFPASPTATGIPAGCVEVNMVIPQIPIEIPLYGSVEETWRNGVGSGINPSSLEFEEGWSGALSSLSEPESSAPFGLEAKVIGAEGQALLTAR